MRTAAAAGMMVAGLLAAGCGGSDDGDAGTTNADTVEPATTQNEATQNEATPGEATPDGPSSDEGSADAGGEPGPVTVTAPPGHGVIEVDGETIVVTWDEARFKSCEITDNSIEVEFTIDDGPRLAIRGGDATVTGEWGAIAYVSAADSREFQYELRVPDNAELGLGDSALSMEGGAVYMEGFAPVDDELRPTTIAVNCDGTE